MTMTLRRRFEAMKGERKLKRDYFGIFMTVVMWVAFCMGHLLVWLFSALQQKNVNPNAYDFINCQGSCPAQAVGYLGVFCFFTAFWFALAR